jgi:hypothetical protein
MKLDYAKDSETQTIEELWVSLSKLSARIVEDNTFSEDYPLEVRTIQLISIKALLRAIEETHIRGE